MHFCKIYVEWKIQCCLQREKLLATAQWLSQVTATGPLAFRDVKNAER